MHFAFPNISYRLRRRSQEAEKEMSVLLNMYKVIPKDQRDKATLLQIEAKLNKELMETRSQLADLKLANADLQARCAQLQREFRIAAATTSTLKRSLEEQSDLADRKVATEGLSVSTSAEPSPMEGSVAGTSTSSGATNPSHQSGSSPISGAMNAVSPEGAEKSQLSGSSLPPPPPPPPPPAPHPLMPPVPRKSNLDEDKKAWQLAELQQELQHTQRRCQTLEMRVSTLQQHLVTARQQEDVMLKEMEVRCRPLVFTILFGCWNYFFCCLFR